MKPVNYPVEIRVLNQVRNRVLYQARSRVLNQVGNRVWDPARAFWINVQEEINEAS